MLRRQVQHGEAAAILAVERHAFGQQTIEHRHQHFLVAGSAGFGARAEQQHHRRVPLRRGAVGRQFGLQQQVEQSQRTYAIAGSERVQRGAMQGAMALVVDGVDAGAARQQPRRNFR